MTRTYIPYPIYIHTTSPLAFYKLLDHCDSIVRLQCFRRCAVDRFPYSLVLSRVRDFQWCLGCSVGLPHVFFSTTVCCLPKLPFRVGRWRLSNFIQIIILYDRQLLRPSSVKLITPDVKCCSCLLTNNAFPSCTPSNA